VKIRLLDFINQLRDAGVRASVAESLDAMAAAAAVGVEQEALRAGLATTLIKDQADRPTFDTLFDRFFAVAGRTRARGERPQPVGEGIGQGESGTGHQRPDQRSERGTAPTPHHERQRRPAQREDTAAERAAHRRRLLELPFDAMDARAVEEAEDLAAELSRHLRAHLCRRYQRAPAGRLDFRRTIRASLGSGGVPIDPMFRTRRPGKLDLIGLCDLSHSTAIAADFCLALLAPATAFFRRVHLFGYVDQLVEISFERGHVIPHQPLDLAARSDFGQVLRQLWEHWEPLLSRNTVVLILGDARNNRRPPRADILARIRNRVRRVMWLNPEPRARWSSGDSVIDSYVKHCDDLFTAGNLRELQRALRAAL